MLILEFIKELYGTCKNKNGKMSDFQGTMGAFTLMMKMLLSGTIHNLAGSVGKVG